MAKFYWSLHGHMTWNGLICMQAEKVYQPEKRSEALLSLLLQSRNR